eukprot:GHVU01207683.1.p1 GENE.GHVU01207683.1~~GHVU01207683.1.p1  ORF type:complete len:115 (+),score=1.88 GHVU01207683.1:390-734(+)
MSLMPSHHPPPLASCMHACIPSGMRSHSETDRLPRPSGLASTRPPFRPLPPSSVQPPLSLSLSVSMSLSLSLSVSMSLSLSLSVCLSEYIYIERDETHCIHTQSHRHIRTTVTD